MNNCFSCLNEKSDKRKIKKIINEQENSRVITN